MIGSKRNFLRLTAAGIFVPLLRPQQARAQRARAQRAAKISKQQAEYQDSPKGIQSCATCSLFDEPRGCKVVEGDISPDGWCTSYAMAD
jgi:High potential iron-sulfur protein